LVRSCGNCYHWEPNRSTHADKISEGECRVAPPTLNESASWPKTKKTDRCGSWWPDNNPPPAGPRGFWDKLSDSIPGALISAIFNSLSGFFSGNEASAEFAIVLPDNQGFILKLERDNEDRDNITIELENLANHQLGFEDTKSGAGELNKAQLRALVSEVIKKLILNENPKPAVPIEKSIADDYLICLEDGKSFKSLKRHLRSHYDMTPEEYRKKWGLPDTYPMVAPSYAKARSEIAKELALERKSGTSIHRKNK